MFNNTDLFIMFDGELISIGKNYLVENNRKVGDQIGPDRVIVTGEMLNGIGEKTMKIGAGQCTHCKEHSEERGIHITKTVYNGRTDYDFDVVCTPCLNMIIKGGSVYVGC